MKSNTLSSKTLSPESKGSQCKHLRRVERSGLRQILGPGTSNAPSGSASWPKVPNNACGSHARPHIMPVISVAAEIVPQSLLKFHLRQEELLNLILRQMAPIRKNGKYFGEEVIVSSFLPPTEKIWSSYQIFTCEWDYRTMLRYNACLRVFLWKSSGFCHIGINHSAMSRRQTYWASRCFSQRTCPSRRCIRWPFPKPSRNLFT